VTAIPTQLHGLKSCHPPLMALANRLALPALGAFKPPIEVFVSKERDRLINPVIMVNSSALTPFKEALANELQRIILYSDLIGMVSVETSWYLQRPYEVTRIKFSDGKFASLGDGCFTIIKKFPFLIREGSFYDFVHSTLKFLQSPRLRQSPV
jgi:hypothetical protein